MSKSINQFVRKFHRWLALPMVIINLTILMARETALGASVPRG